MTPLDLKTSNNVTEKPTSPDDFTIGAVYDFTSDSSEVCRVYRFRAIIEPKLSS